MFLCFEVQGHQNLTTRTFVSSTLIEPGVGGATAEINPSSLNSTVSAAPPSGCCQPEGCGGVTMTTWPLTHIHDADEAASGCFRHTAAAASQSVSLLSYPGFPGARTYLPRLALPDDGLGVGVVSGALLPQRRHHVPRGNAAGEQRTPHHLFL